MNAVTSPSTLREAWTVGRAIARARYELRGARLGERVRCYGPLVVEGAKGFRIGERVAFLDGMFPTELRCAPGGSLVIGARCVFNYGVSIVAESSVRIGARCMFGSLVQIGDASTGATGDVVLGDDVWVAHGAVIEPGTTIGDGAVIGAGAVVRGVVPPRVLAAGNPARFVPLEAATSTPSIPVEAPAPSEPALDATPAPERAEVRQAIIDWLDDTRHFGEAESMIKSDDVSLRDAGLLDSLGLVQLVLMLEQRFAVTIDRAIMAAPNHLSMNGLVDIVRRARAGR